VELTSLVIVVANASANPASAASIFGDNTATNPVTPMTADDKRVKRTESHRLTVYQDVK
jgi:hypothetical protein